MSDNTQDTTDNTAQPSFGGDAATPAPATTPAFGSGGALEFDGPLATATDNPAPIEPVAPVHPAATAHTPQPDATPGQTVAEAGVAWTGLPGDALAPDFALPQHGE